MEWASILCGIGFYLLEKIYPKIKHKICIPLGIALSHLLKNTKKNANQGFPQGFTGRNPSLARGFRSLASSQARKLAPRETPFKSTWGNQIYHQFRKPNAAIRNRGKSILITHK
uniref:Uncharacterized protein n=1 Tax=Caulerpa verticillata TaxID=177082 RepID=A0A386B0C3_9CHLO|nr:hypothetical protein [Caulerpa verticillata]AYC65142.1 hypothetical protein [Caulerpa verticillata]